jgi:hypothetical protein
MTGLLLGSVITTGAASTVMTTVCEPAPAALVAVTSTVYDPAAMGVPEITPVSASIESPGGRTVAPKVAGPLIAVTVWLNAEPNVPPALVVLVRTGAGAPLTNTSVDA